MAYTTEQNTGTENRQYDLVSVLYHALEGGATIEQYISDAQNAGDEEAASFFQEVQSQYRQLADRAKSLLKSRI
ncbi:MAG: hypothetical protein ICV62_00530 [Cyanobacteria bacterium Co-bin13]|nr:hypothetical protein [Cyanobacteria bacterium Co-bin13]